MIIGVDHILIAVENVEKAAEVYRRLGFQVVPGGEHPRMGTYNALVPLEDGSYLELIGVKDRAKAEQFPNSGQVVRALERENRLATFALDTNDLPSDIKMLRERGLQIGAPVEGERMRPDGKKVAWRSAHFQDPNLPFLIEDITPHHVRVPMPSEGLGQGAWLAEVLVRATSVADASRVWKDLLGAVPAKDDEFKLERATIRLVPNDGQPTGIAAFSLAVDDLDNAVQKLKAGGVKLTESAGAVELDVRATAGAQMRLVRG
jgi:catechol 2,3-dioxygenase-like lactoylglutathione lyase family enzyme